jgi:beta-ureidopropionase / N-carbamoyl-L-amino-acid hydrolase
VEYSYRTMSSRRSFIAQLAMLTAAASLRVAAQPQSPRTNAARLRSWIEELSIHGRPAGGTFTDGVSRTAYSDADVAGRQYVMGLMRAAGLDPKIDFAGNIFATRAGTDSRRKPILFGSHIDSVKSGGNFDGDLGSLSSIETIRVLNEQKIATRHPLEVVVWAAEEWNYSSGLSGSRAAAGLLEEGELGRVQDRV